MTRARMARYAAGGIVAALALTLLTPVAGIADQTPNHPETTRFTPAALDRGHTQMPYMRGKVLHDGNETLRLKIPNLAQGQVQQLGRGYLAAAWAGKNGWGQTLYRVAPQGKTTKLRTFSQHVWSVHVDSRGRKVAVETFDPGRLIVFDAHTNNVIRRTRLGENENVLGYVDGQILLSRGVDHSALSWYQPHTDSTKRIGNVPGWAKLADPELNVIALSAGDGHTCFDIRRFTPPRRKLWRLCPTTGILAGLWFSPNGKYVLTHQEFHDRPPLDTIVVRKVSDGTVVHRFKTRLFGGLGWGNNHTVVMQASAQGKAAMVKCTVTGNCQRVTNVVQGRNDKVAIWNLNTTFFNDRPTAF